VTPGRSRREVDQVTLNSAAYTDNMDEEESEEGERGKARERERERERESERERGGEGKEGEGEKRAGESFIELEGRGES